VSADHLARLVARTRQDGGAVQPRLPAMFEPVRPGGAAWSLVPAAGSSAPPTEVGATASSTSEEPTLERRRGGDTGTNDPVGYELQRDLGTTASRGRAPRGTPDHPSAEPRSAEHGPAHGVPSGLRTSGGTIEREPAEPGPGGGGGGAADLEAPSGGGRPEDGPVRRDSGREPPAVGPIRPSRLLDPRPSGPALEGPSPRAAARALDATPPSGGVDDGARRRARAAADASPASDDGMTRPAASDVDDGPDHEVAPGRPETPQQRSARARTHHPFRQVPGDPGEAPRATASAADQPGGVPPDATRSGDDDLQAGHGVVHRDMPHVLAGTTPTSASVPGEPGARTSSEPATPAGAGSARETGRAVTGGRSSARDEAPDVGAGAHPGGVGAQERSDRPRDGRPRDAGRLGSTDTDGSLATTTPPTALVPRPERRGGSAAGAPPSETSSPPAAAPTTIRVTIGRVEVRAAPERPSPPERHPPPAPSLSLEDHLRRQRQGRT
jgi:hypothetical protein